MLKFLSFFLFLNILFPSFAFASSQNSYIHKHIKNADVVGTGRLTYLFWDVYDATLIAPNGELSFEKPFALTLHYLRDINGRDIADVSAEEIRKQGGVDEIKIAMWHEKMRNVFPNVQKGSVLTGVYLPKTGVEFFYNGRSIEIVKDADFSKHFFDIWLGSQTSKPQLRRALTGV